MSTSALFIDLFRLLNNICEVKIKVGTRKLYGLCFRMWVTVQVGFYWTVDHLYNVRNLL